MNILQMNEGRTLGYQLIDGDVDKPYLVFLHEGLGCIGMWKDFPRRLCKATRCPGLLYDRMGYGSSSLPVMVDTVNFMHKYALIELPAVLSILLPDREYCLIGHSDGGSIGLIHASEQPRLLKGVVTLAAHVLVEQVTVDSIRGLYDSFQKGDVKGFSKYHGDKTDELVLSWAKSWLKPSFAPWNIEYLLAAIECPLLVMQGEDDQYGTLHQVEAICAGVGHAQSVIFGQCGHSPHLQQQKRTIEAISSFLAKRCGIL